MIHLKENLHRWSQAKYADFILVLLTFMVLRLLSVYGFYNGFLENFDKLASVFPKEQTVAKIIRYVPYHSWSICLAALLHPLFLIILVLVYIPVIYKKRFLIMDQVSFAKADKVLIFICAVLLSWELCTYDYNYYLDSAFFFDRLVLFLLPFLIVRYPLLVPLYVAFAFVYRSQFNYPVSGFDLFDKRVLFDILLMFTSVAYVRLYIPKTTVSFFYFVICIVGSNYFMSGIVKIFMSPHGYDWLLSNKISDLFINVHARGWLAHYDEAFIRKCWILLEKYNVLLQFLILVLELAAVFLLRNIRYAFILLIMLCLMHFAIFLVGSMLFWKWMLVDLSLAVLLWKHRGDYRELFSKRMFWCSVVIIVASAAWLKPYTIGWFDTPYNQYFTYEAEDKYGKVVELGKNELNPYHQWFQYDKFLFLVDKPCLQMSGFGYVKNYRVKQCLDTIPPDQLSSLEEKFGKNGFSGEKAEAFRNFIRTYFASRNRRKCELFLTKLRPPHHIYNQAPGEGLEALDEIKKFRVIYNIIHNEQGKIVPVEKHIIEEIII